MDFQWTWWVLALIPVAWLIQNCIHELSHFLFARLHYKYAKILGFYPYPHMYCRKWYFARICLGGVPAIPNKQVHIAPFIAGIIWMFLCVVVMLTTRTFWPLPFAICGLVDALWFWYGYLFRTDYCDGTRWKHG